MIGGGSFGQPEFVDALSVSSAEGLQVFPDGLVDLFQLHILSQHVFDVGRFVLGLLGMGTDGLDPSAGGSAPKREPFVADGDLGHGVVAAAALAKSDGGRPLRLLGCLAAGVDFDGWLHDC